MQHHCLHLVPKGNPREPIRDERVNITFRWVREHRYRCPLRWQKAPLPRSLRGILGEIRPRHPGDVDGEDRGPPKSLLNFGMPYVRCWSREVLGGVLADPERMEWRLCDGCKHVCYEEGRLCCEGRGDWEGRWFCRKCWAKWGAEAVPELPPHGALAPADERLQQLYHGGCDQVWGGVAVDAAGWWPAVPSMLGSPGLQVGEEASPYGMMAPFAPQWFPGQGFGAGGYSAATASGLPDAAGLCGTIGGDMAWGRTLAPAPAPAPFLSNPLAGAGPPQSRPPRPAVEAREEERVCEPVAALFAAAGAMTLPAMPGRSINRLSSALPPARGLPPPAAPSAALLSTPGNVEGLRPAGPRLAFQLEGSPCRLGPAGAPRRLDTPVSPVHGVARSAVGASPSGAPATPPAARAREAEDAVLAPPASPPALRSLVDERAAARGAAVPPAPAHPPAPPPPPRGQGPPAAREEERPSRCAGVPPPPAMPPPPPPPRPSGAAAAAAAAGAHAPPAPGPRGPGSPVGAAPARRPGGSAAGGTGAPLPPLPFEPPPPPSDLPPPPPGPPPRAGGLGREGGAGAAAAAGSPAALAAQLAARSRSEPYSEHELSCGWCLWLLLLDRHGTSWEESQRQVHGPMASVEAFWQLRRHIHPASTLCDADYSFFQEGLSPAREEPLLAGGGRWLLAVVKGGPSQARGHVAEPHFAGLVDAAWDAVLLAAIGERFCESCGGVRNACGVVVSLRERASQPPQHGAAGSAAAVAEAADSLASAPAAGRTAKLALWLQDAEDKEQVLAVGRLLREVLEQAVPDTARTPRGGWRLAFEDFRRRSVTLRL